MTGALVVEELRVPLRDGTALATDVVRVDDGVPRPVLLVRTPYSRASVRTGHDPIALARSGWVVVVQDVRGRWGSAGRFRPFGQEVDDGHDVVTWCAGQPWSTGDVVMSGASYDGLTAWLAAEAAPASLRAIAPIVSAPDTRDPWVRRGGALQLGFLLNWGLGLGLAGGGGDPEVAEDGLGWLTEWRSVVRSPDAVDRLVRLFPPGRRWLEPDDGRDLPAPAHGGPIQAEGLPVFHLTGWFDIFVEGALAAYAALRGTPAGPAQRLVVGPWTHGSAYGTFAGEVDFGYGASGAGRFPGERLEFLRRAAAGEPVTGGASIFVMGRDEWVELEGWPPPTRATVLHLAGGGPAGTDPALGTAGGGLLTNEEPSSATRTTWHHDPLDPVPTLGGRTLHPALAVAGPVARSATAGRGDVLVFTGEPLTADLTVAGAVRVELEITSDTPLTDLTCALVDVHPDGRALGVVDGIRRLRTVPGETRTVALEVGSTAMTFLRGHRIRLELASSNHPAYDLTPAGRRTLRHGRGTQTRLVLPTL